MPTHIKIVTFLTKPAKNFKAVSSFSDLMATSGSPPIKKLAPRKCKIVKNVRTLVSPFIYIYFSMTQKIFTPKGSWLKLIFSSSTPVLTHNLIMSSSFLCIRYHPPHHSIMLLLRFRGWKFPNTDIPPSGNPINHSFNHQNGFPLL